MQNRPASPSLACTKPAPRTGPIGCPPRPCVSTSRGTLRACRHAIVLLSIGLWITTAPVARAGESDNPLDVNMNDPVALHEATRVLAEEVKLAARAQTYLLIDLPAKTVALKARGVELYRLSIMEWSADYQDRMTGLFRLTARPAVIRRKVDPSGMDQEPISLADMPDSYDLLFTPPLTLTVLSSAEQAPIRWTVLHLTRWWRWLTRRVRALASSTETQPDPAITLTLVDYEAQSLAWSLTDGMPAIIRRTSRQ